MKIGEKISELRKKNNLTQEELAEKLSVTRQTISKWELGETSPSLDDAATLASIFQVSLDTLVGKDNVLEEKMSNVERLAGIIIKILKVIGVLIIIYFVFLVVAVLAFNFLRSENVVEVSSSITCQMNDKTETYQVMSKDDEIIVSKNAYDIIDVSSFQDSDEVLDAIINYYEANSGSCN